AADHRASVLNGLVQGRQVGDEQVAAAQPRQCSEVERGHGRERCGLHQTRRALSGQDVGADEVVGLGVFAAGVGQVAVGLDDLFDVDLGGGLLHLAGSEEEAAHGGKHGYGRNFFHDQASLRDRDRKSTRLNSSHVKISYAVFCLKKNNIEISIDKLIPC